MLIKAILIVAVLVLVFLFTWSDRGARHQALGRIGLLLLTVAAIFAILVPSALSAVATFVNVGRGTDLLVYALVIAFFAAMIAASRRNTALNRKITLLTRELAIQEARTAQGLAAAAPSPATPSPGVPDPSGSQSTPAPEA